LGTKKWLILLPTIMAVGLTLARRCRGTKEEEENENKKEITSCGNVHKS
jgi:hypothetical protein